MKVARECDSPLVDVKVIKKSISVIGKVCELSRRCWVEKEVLISPGPSKMYRCHLGSVTVVREV